MMAEPTSGPSFVRVEKRRAFEVIVDQLQQMIIEGELQAGDRLPNERVLSQMLGVSRPSLREALRVLEGLQIIDVRPGAGAASGSLIARDAGGALTSIIRLHLALGHFGDGELVALRRVIEGESARQAARVATTPQLERLRALVAQMQSLIDDVAEYRKVDAQFHIAIAEVAGNRLMTQLMQALRDPIIDAITGAIPEEEWASVADLITAQHAAIVSAIASRNAEGRAEAAIDEHLSFYDTHRRKGRPLHTSNGKTI